MSPARIYVEQSRNTLLFASCAKEVTTNARVNVVMSDKALVKHLQRELARLESELSSASPTSGSLDTDLLREKDFKIEEVILVFKSRIIRFLCYHDSANNIPCILARLMRISCHFLYQSTQFL